MYVEKLLPESVFNLLVQRLVVRRIKQHHADYYIEVTGFNYISASIINRHFSGVKIVHIIRDPRDFVTSFLNWVHRRRKSWIAHNLTPFWNVSGYLAGEMSKSEWSKMDEFERYCWQWKYKNQKILELYSNDKENFITFRFEDLISSTNNKKTLDELLTFIGLPYSPGSEEYFQVKQNVSDKRYFSNWRNWNKERCRQLQNICGHLMEQYDYGTEPEWQKNCL